MVVQITLVVGEASVGENNIGMEGRLLSCFRSFGHVVMNSKHMDADESIVKILFPW